MIKLYLKNKQEKNCHFLQRTVESDRNFKWKKNKNNFKKMNDDDRMDRLQWATHYVCVCVGIAGRWVPESCLFSFSTVLFWKQFFHRTGNLKKKMEVVYIHRMASIYIAIGRKTNDRPVRLLWCQIELDQSIKEVN